MTATCIKVDKVVAEKTRRILRSNGLIDEQYAVFRGDDSVFIPVKKPVEALSLLEEEGINASLVECSPPARPSRSMVLRIPSYDLVGDIIIVREKACREYGDERELVKTLTSLHPRVKAIYVKESTETAYRVSKLRLLWGVDKDVVYAKEYGLTFLVKIKEVYYNPRFSTEHRRVAELVADNETVFDLFAGIGGFSIHIACLRRARVVANDVNPSAIYCLLYNIMLNAKKLRGEVAVSYSDVRELKKYVKKGSADRIIANLPHHSLEFIDVYNHLSHEGSVLHLYVVGGEDDVGNATRILESYNWVPTGVSRVIDYAPHKFIYRIDAVKRNNDE